MHALLALLNEKQAAFELLPMQKVKGTQQETQAVLTEDGFRVIVFCRSQKKEKSKYPYRLQAEVSYAELQASTDPEAVLIGIVTTLIESV